MLEIYHCQDLNIASSVVISSLINRNKGYLAVEFHERLDQKLVLNVSVFVLVKNVLQANVSVDK